MRIISGYKDYYDCMQSEGQDQTCVWVRNLETFYLDKYPFPTMTKWRSNRERLIFHHISIGFCGKVYTAIRVSVNTSGGLTALCYSSDEVERFIHDNFDARQVEAFEKKSYYDRRSIGITRKALKRFWDEIASRKESYEKIFLENNCPLFVCDESWRGESTFVFHGRRDTEPVPFTLDAKIKDKSLFTYRIGDSLLKNYEFYKVFSTQAAFQELHMYIGGVLGIGNPHVPVPDDVTMRDIKGFDEFSFKKQKKQ